MITTTAVSPYAMYGRPTVTTLPSYAARIGVYFGAAMSIPLWNPPHRGPKGDVSGPVSGHIARFEPVNAPHPHPTAAAAASISYRASASVRRPWTSAVLPLALPVWPCALFPLP